jgi:Co/Zn/Cd efflux system component
LTRSEFLVPKMDCPTEESLIRMKLHDFQDIKFIEVDVPNRLVAVLHDGSPKEIEKAITALDLGGKLTRSLEIGEPDLKDERAQTKLLWAVLSINFVFFIVESLFGLLSQSMGLVADSLDMLADSFVYAISLFAVGGTVLLKKRVSKLAGVFQVILAALGLVEVLRRFIGLEEMPHFVTMIGVSILALLANAACLYILQKSKSKEAHIQASMIFTSNDVIINLGVIIAGALVFFFESSWPDLVIGSIVFLVVIQGAIRILRLSN